MFKNIDKIKQVEHEDDWWTVFFIRPFAIRFVALIQDTWITPNQLTLLSFILVFFACFFIAGGTHINFIIAAVLLHAAYIMDLSDGLLARFKHASTPFGGWFDNISDRIKEFCIIVSLSMQYRPFSPKVLTISLYAFFLIAMYHGYLTKNLPQKTNEENSDFSKNKLEWLNHIRHTLKLGFFNLGEQMFLYELFLLLNRIDLFFPVFTVYGTLSVISFAMLKYRSYYAHRSNEN